MAELTQYLVSGLALGVIYGLVALGFVVVYRASQVFNFAHGELLTFGAVLMAWLASEPLPENTPTGLGMSVDGVGLPWLLALFVAIVATGALAALIERFALRPLVGRPVFVPIIITLFIGFILRTLVVLLFGTESMPAITPWDSMGSITLAGAMLDYNSIAAVVAGVLVFGGFGLLIRFAPIGVAMRATASDQEASLAAGIPVGRVLGVTWFIAGACAAIAGVFLGVRDYSVDMNLGFIAMRAFPAVIVGGLDSTRGAILAGLLFGLLEVLTAAYINNLLGPMGRNFHVVLPYLVMILVLVVRPYGMFGTKKVERL